MNRPLPPEDDVDAGHVTPVMAQFIEIKAANPDSLLFYRMGDFYELFFEDAEIAARALGIVLTKRGKHKGEDIPMCGVPIHRADEYLQRLIALGHRVAVCEQLEDPAEAKKRGSKSVVRRDVVRLVTPGTLTEDALLEAGRANWLMGVTRLRGADSEARFGLAWTDLSTGAFRVGEATEDTLAAEIARVDPAEIVVADSVHDDPALKALWRGQRAAVTPLPRVLFDGATAVDRLTHYFGVATLDAFGGLTRAEAAAAAGTLAYIEKTQVEGRPALDPPRREGRAATLLIDPATRANLELTRSMSGERRGSLLDAIDRTVTGPGQRLLAERIASPLMAPEAIDRRLDAVAWALSLGLERGRVREALKAAPDMARPLSRLALGRGGPRDLLALARGLTAAQALAAHLAAQTAPEEIALLLATLAQSPQALSTHLTEALSEDAPLLARDGGFIRTGYSEALDELRSLTRDSRQTIARLEADYQLETGIRSLKIRHNNVLGWFIDTTPQHAERLREPALVGRFIHRQTLANAVRFTTTELADLEARMATAGDRAVALENEVFARLVAEALSHADAIKHTAAALAALDVATALAELAEEGGYTRPRVDDSLAFQIIAGRHPVVEAALKAQGGTRFVPNECDLSPPPGAEHGRLLVLTGPNMGGKSTYLRQNALIAILAQAGSYVPAESAHIGVVDRLFSRVGASDDLARGRSTFMVEMVETAAILNQAGPRALVILDEIGRGTATFDGLSIAWAAIEHLHDVNRARAVFATHFHELTALQQRLARLGNATVKVREWNGDVVFLYEIGAGAADRSYGIQVARLASLPPAAIERAREVLRQLEDQARKRPAVALIDDLPLFSNRAPPPPAPRAPALPPHASELIAALDAIHPDDLTPREALDALYRLKAIKPK